MEGPQPQQRPGSQRTRLGVYHDVLRRLRDAAAPEALAPDFADRLWAHFHRFSVRCERILPRYLLLFNVRLMEFCWSRIPFSSVFVFFFRGCGRYALDVNAERAEDVLVHMQLLDRAKHSENQPAFSVRVVQVPAPPELDATEPDSSEPNSIEEGASATSGKLKPMHEITFASKDRPKGLTQLSALLGQLNLDIKEVHALSTNDGYFLDIFIVVGWDHKETLQLEEALEKEIHNYKAQMHSTSSCWPPELAGKQCPNNSQEGSHVEIPKDNTDEWEINFKALAFQDKVASETYGDLYRGTYFGEDVAIKVLKSDRLNENMEKEFAHEVYIVSMQNLKRLICIYTGVFFLDREFMVRKKERGKHSYRRKSLLSELKAIKEAESVTRILFDFLGHAPSQKLYALSQLIKVADFGVARVKAESGVMTAETGTYRWMAPEVIEHKPYDSKADVFSFGIVLWELLTGKIPYEFLTPLQAAIGVVQEGLRPVIPRGTNPKLAQLLEKCWQQNPINRPDFTEILQTLNEIAEEVPMDPNKPHKEKEKGGSFFSFGKGH
ncbi:serine/threonine-protein kinase STY46 isoform X2 [Panicum miliaceum]|uniref:Serine/threonine-protein kinase STY46 isoform X2 n=1 Tax=Panicum miliaceum TaxID=4540 RepID=A0A3L6S011_PANMI|nr:serine/threonine-protein kinase STY46 isoform X2 [Panicum miliaceum]